MNNQKKLIFIGVAVLVILFLLTLLFSRVFRQREPGEAPTPVPTGFFEGRGENNLETTLLTQAEKIVALNKLAQQVDDALSEEQVTSLSAFRQKLPIDTADCAIAYSVELNQYFISEKTPQADETCKTILQENGVLDIYEGGFEVFVVTDEPITTAVQESRADILNAIEHGDPEHNIDEAAKTQPTESKRDRDLKLFTDLLKTTLTFDLGGGRSLREVLESSGEQAETGGAGGGGGGGGNQNEEEVTKGDISFPSNLGKPNSLGYYQLPSSKEYTIYSCPARRYGKKDLIGVIYTVAGRYNEKYKGSKVSVGDLNAGAPHVSHRWGVAVDLDACCSPRAADYTKGDYSRQATIELGKMFVETDLIKNIWYCDNAVNQAVISHARKNNLSLEQMKCISGHDNHFHIDINVPHGPDHAPSC